jgi:hypothetical protein
MGVAKTVVRGKERAVTDISDWEIKEGRKEDKEPKESRKTHAAAVAFT